jgi:putative intracellular protease/amidase
MKTVIGSSVIVAILIFIVMFATFTAAGTSTIGILVFDGFLTSDVTAPIEVFGAAVKKPTLSSYNVMVISADEREDCSI